MISLFLNLPGWATVIPPVALLLLCAPAVAIFVPPKWWPLAFGAVALLAACWLGLLVARGFYQRGKADCDAAHASAATQQQGADQARTDQADAANAATQAGAHTIERHYSEKVREIYRDRPAGPCLDADGLRRIREADAALAGAAAGNSPRGLLPSAAADKGDGSGGS